MQGKDYRKILLKVCVAAASFCLCVANGYAQEGGRLAPSSSSPLETSSEVSALSELIHDLQTQVQVLNSQLSDLRTEQQRASAEARELRRELDLVKAPTSAAPQDTATPDRLGKLEENQEVIEAKVNDQYQTKIESGSKYRLRLSGIVLLNMFENRGPVDNQDFPQLVNSPQLDPIAVSPASFGGSLRQSQLRLQAFGPDIVGARTSACRHRARRRKWHRRPHRFPPLRRPLQTPRQRLRFSFPPLRRPTPRQSVPPARAVCSARMSCRPTWKRGVRSPR